MANRAFRNRATDDQLRRCSGCQQKGEDGKRHRENKLRDDKKVLVLCGYYKLPLTAPTPITSYFQKKQRLN